MTQRVLLYCRQSDTSGYGEESLSLETQEYELREHAQRERWDIVGVLLEPDYKGWMDEKKRPKFREALERAERGEYDILLFWNIDRFARGLRLQENTIYDLGRHGVDIRSHTEPWVSGDPMFRQILGSVAEAQLRLMSKNIRRALAGRARKGLPHGFPPIGFVKGTPKGGFVVDRDTIPVAIEILTRYDGGEGIAAICHDLTRRGIPTPKGYQSWRYQTLRHILTRPIYAGLWQSHDGLVQVPDESLLDGQPPVSRELWERVQRRLAGENRGSVRTRAPRQKAHASWLEGRIVHECGQPMYLAPGSRKTPPHFRCRSACHKDQMPACGIYPQSISAAKAERLVRERLADDLAEIRPVRSVVAAAERTYRSVAPLADRQRRELADRRSRAEGRRRNAEELYLTGARDRAWFDIQDAAVAAELAAIAADVARLPEAPERAQVEGLGRFLRDLRSLVADAPGPTLGTAVGKLGRVVLGEDGIMIAYSPDVAAFLGQTPHHSST